MNECYLKKKLLFTIWMLSKQESFLAAGDRFNLAKSTSHQIFFTVVNLIANLTNEFIIWPDDQERQRISSVLQARSGKTVMMYTNTYILTNTFFCHFRNTWNYRCNRWLPYCYKSTTQQCSRLL